MSNQDLQIFLNIIDGRIKKYINDNRLLKEYPAIVTEKSSVTINPNELCRVRLAGYDTEFTFINKTHETLTGGDFVYIKTIGTDLNTGVISQKN